MRGSTGANRATTMRAARRVSAGLLLLALCTGCGRSGWGPVTARVTSPDGALAAILVRTATPGSAGHVYSLFVTDRGATADEQKASHRQLAASRDSSLQLEWVDSARLRVSYRSARISGFYSEWTTCTGANAGRCRTVDIELRRLE